GADSATLNLSDADTQTYYAPVARGLGDADLRGSLSDMRDQLARYRADAAQGKAPAELHVPHYGPNVWLTVMRRPLIARDAANEIDSSFIRRHHIQSVLGLPLLSGDALVGLLYLDFRARPGAARTVSQRLEADQIAGLDREAGQAGLAIERAREAEERTAFAAIGKLAGELSAPPADGAAASRGIRHQLEPALAELLAATGFAAAAVYQLGIEPGHLELVSRQGLPTAPVMLSLDGPTWTALPATTGAAEMGFDAVERALGATDLHVIATFPLRMMESLHGYLLILSPDRLALARRAPLTNLLLQTTADLMAGALANQRLVSTL